MICVIALVVFGILGIFSARYREVAKEAFECVFRRLTFRKCNSELDERLKSQITGKIMRRSPRIAGFIYKRFEIISWIFLILMIWSMIVSATSVYNYVKYGNCNGPGSDGFCPLDVIGGTQTSTCSAVPNHTNLLVNPGPGNDTIIGPGNAQVTIIEFGCYSCEYSKKAEATVRKILEQYSGRVDYVFRDFPIIQHENSTLEAEAARCAGDQGKFWEYHQLLFDWQNQTDSVGTVYRVAGQINLNLSQFTSCIDSDIHLAEVNADYQAGLAAGVYGTPTFFINDKNVVGPKPYANFKSLIDSELKKAGGK
jgi:protein-disulfide isomerase